jgi:hypothetical protein
LDQVLIEALRNMPPAHPFCDVGIAIGVLREPPVRGVRFDGAGAGFVDGAFFFVGEKLAEFGTRHVPLGFWDYFGGTTLTAAGVEELGWFADTLGAALAEYPEHWEVDAGDKIYPVERESLRQELRQLGEIVRRARAEGRAVASMEVC